MLKLVTGYRSMISDRLNTFQLKPKQIIQLSQDLKKKKTYKKTYME